MSTTITEMAACLLASAVILVLGFLFWLKPERRKAEDKLAEALQLREQTDKELQTKRKEVLLEAKDEAHRMRAEIEHENRERKSEIQRLERRLTQKEETLDRRLENLERKEASLTSKEQDTEKLRVELEALLKEQRSELQRISGLSEDEARTIYLKSIEDDAKHDAARLIRDIEAQAKEEADKRAREVVTLAIQRCAVDQTSETTVSVVPLPGDEMKGRIIGREGRNIRAFETLTGVDLIIDDTPEAVVLSGFDPVRREIARIALSNLISDGRIHPGRIEEVINKAQAEVEAKMREAGERAIFETGVTALDPDIIKLLGRLRFRTSYGQSVLNHSIEVAHLAGAIAGEIGGNIALAKRAGLLHDLGKAVDFEVEGPHATIGADICRKMNEHPEVIKAVGAHHGDEPQETMEAVIVSVADAISAARPGARRETLETYVKRLQRLETIADSFSGVEKTYAVQAGREIRVMVKPTEIDDVAAAKLAHDTAKKIEEEMEYPGQIKVTVIRETRSVDYAK
ncbi:MAG TPA: ribonuclease Y [Armatimonadetes bacterium]|jgi:ribonuclease Y|nr:ribonuclease Y [Armatimonadota bacterium]